MKILNQRLPILTETIKFTSGNYMGFPVNDFQQAITAISGGAAPFSKEIDGRTIKGFTCPGSIDKLPNLEITIGTFTY